MINQIFIKDFISNKYFFNIQRASIFSPYHVHTHDFSELVVITGGSATHIVNSDAYPIRAGHVFVVDKRCAHGFTDVESLNFFNVMYDADQFLVTGSELKKLPGFQALFILEPFYRKDHKFNSKLELSPEKLMDAENLLNIISQEYAQAGEGFKTMIQAYFTALVIFLSREYAESSSVLSERLLRIADAIVYIEQYYTDSIKLDDLAAKAFMSTRHFIRVFKQNYNVTPMEYIINLRLKHACNLLKTSRLSITDIALESGFSDSNYFTRLFKQEYGVVPSKYKKLMES